ncbi:hypothetical protein [Massilibacteroides sp.]|uniref:hypothetical protein n=1 Tax=Massilibacteroides sp. TaxID=2034766 RepID=UPI002632FA5A|nr:hypothetical protein [Massilibacteroides sp.]MDD4514658.1 hypothetical protein [Massilibacteroides sp.]
MKLCLLFFSVITLAACSVGRTTETRGLENEAYLSFVRGTTDKYSDGVQVYIDDNAPFKAKVNKVRPSTVKGDTYVIKSGKRHLKVVYKNKTLYDKEIIVSTQETKRIELP